MTMPSNLIEIIGVAALAAGLVMLGLLRSQKRRRPDRASLQAQLNMIAAAIDPEYRKPD